MICIKPPSLRVSRLQHPRTSPARRSLPARLLGVAVALAVGCASWLLMPSGPAYAQAVPQPRLSTIELSAGMHNIVAEVARTPQQQQIGMMMRTKMEQHEGMLFVFDDVAPRCFWMRNTLLPLSIAFVADDGTIVNIAEMQPQSDESHCALRPVRYALEMNKGWFAKRGIKPGTKLRGSPFSTAR